MALLPLDTLDHIVKTTNILNAVDRNSTVLLPNAIQTTTTEASTQGSSTSYIDVVQGTDKFDYLHSSNWLLLAAMVIIVWMQYESPYSWLISNNNYINNNSQVRLLSRKSWLPSSVTHFVSYYSNRSCGLRFHTLA